MSIYWDSSALVEAVFEPTLMQRLKSEESSTRVHSLAETFSALTGNSELKIAADDAARILVSLARHLNFIDLTAAETLTATLSARKRGVRGGRIHDYLHAVAAEKAKSTKLLTLDLHDFDGLTTLPIEVL